MPYCLDIKMKTLFHTLTISLLLSSLCSGCNSKRLDGLVPGAGTLSFNGEPVENATIVFSPKIAGSSRSATGITNPQGKFTLMTLDPGDGLAPGDYHVTVTKVKTEGGPTEQEMLDSVMLGRALPPDDRTITYLIPEHYGIIGDSGLEVTIPSQGKRDIPLELTGAVSDQAIPVRNLRK